MLCDAQARVALFAQMVLELVDEASELRHGAAKSTRIRYGWLKGTRPGVETREPSTFRRHLAFQAAPKESPMPVYSRSKLIIALGALVDVESES